jgi:hypothetical protein
MFDLDIRRIYLLKEVEVSIKLLKNGMRDLQKLGTSNDFFHGPILMLSSGYERLIKCLLCLALMDDNGEFQEAPYKSYGKSGHDLDNLLKKLLSICDTKNYSSKFKAAKMDIDFLKDDKHLREIISLFSDFAQAGRYYNLDIVIKGKSDYKDPDYFWTKIENTIMKARKEVYDKFEKGEIEYVSKEINRDIIIILEKYTRALARLFTLADFGDFAKQASPLVHHYLMLTDDKLGTTDYNTI